MLHDIQQRIFKTFQAEFTKNRVNLDYIRVIGCERSRQKKHTVPLTITL